MEGRVTLPFFVTILLWSGSFSLLSKLIHIFYFYSTWWLHLSQFFYYIYWVYCTYSGIWQGIHAELKDKIARVVSLVIPCRFLGWSSGTQDWWQMPLHTETSLCTSKSRFLCQLKILLSGGLAVENPWWMWVQLLASTSSITFYNFSSQGYNTLFWPLWALHSRTQTHKQAYTYTQI